MFVTIEQNTNFKQNIQKNRLKIKELPERKIGEKKSKIGSSLLDIAKYEKLDGAYNVNGTHWTLLVSEVALTVYTYIHI